MSGIQLVGNTNNTTPAEVELNTKAVRTVIRPDDYGSLGIYNIGMFNGATAMAAQTTAGDVFQWRNGNVSNFIVVKRVLFTMLSGGTGFAAGDTIVQLFRATSYSANGTGGTQNLPGAGNKLRTSMGSSLMTSGNNCDIRIGSTAALGAGTKTNDAQPLASLVNGTGTATFTQIVPVNTVLIDQRVGEHPLVLVQNEGFSIQVTTPATGTFFFSVNVDWEELASY